MLRAQAPAQFSVPGKGRNISGDLRLQLSTRTEEDNAGEVRRAAGQRRRRRWELRKESGQEKQAAQKCNK